MLRGFFDDLHLAFTRLGRRPGFALVAILTLALGVGVNTAMFSLANALLFRPLPFPDVARIGRLYAATPGNRYADVSAADFTTIARAGGSLGVFSAYRAAQVTWDEDPRALQWMEATPTLFDVLGLPPASGRYYSTDAEAQAGQTAVISYRVWRDVFALTPAIVGQTIRAGGRTFNVVGVLPLEASDHRLFGRVGVFIPLDVATAGASGRRVDVIWRRSAEISIAEADARIAAALDPVPRPDGGQPVEWRTERLSSSTVSPTGKALVALLLGLALSVLLIACSNLGGVVLASTLERRREFALRAAMGASLGRLTRPLLAESLLLSVAGLGAGLLASTWLTQWLSRTITDGGGIDLPVDWRVVTFAVVVAAVAFCAISLAPALLAIRVHPNAALRSHGRGISGARGANRLRRLAIGAQFSLSVVLLASAVAFLVGTHRLLARDYGWRSDHVLQGAIELPESTYATPEAITAFHKRLVDRLTNVAGVQAASISYGLPYLGLRGRIEARSDGADNQSAFAMLNGVSPSYFTVTGTPIRVGRAFAETDSNSAPGVVIVSESLARRLLGNAPAVGRRLALIDNGLPLWRTIVGVVADAGPIDIAATPNVMQVYQPVAQDPRAVAIVAVRTSSVPPERLADSVRAALAELDDAVVIPRLTSAEALIGTVTVQVALVQRLLAGFAGAGMLLACLGLYGAVSRMVAERTHEVGIRRAIGAQARDVIVLIVGAGSRIAIVGTAVGAALAYGAVQFLASTFPGMATSPFLTVIAVAAGLATMAALVCFASARRVTSIDPAIALRAE